jgi:hypothetical protein
MAGNQGEKQTGRLAKSSKPMRIFFACRNEVLPVVFVVYLIKMCWQNSMMIEGEMTEVAAG